MPTAALHSRKQSNDSIYMYVQIIITLHETIHSTY